LGEEDDDDGRHQQAALGDLSEYSSVQLHGDISAVFDCLLHDRVLLPFDGTVAIPL
jgi:hypothetical protein